MVLLLWVLQGRALEWAHCGGQARGYSRRGTCREPRRLQQLEPTRWLHRSRDPVALSDLRPAVDPELLWAGHRRPIFMPRPPPRHGRSLGPSVRPSPCPRCGRRAGEANAAPQRPGPSADDSSPTQAERPRNHPQPAPSRKPAGTSPHAERSRRFRLLGSSPSPV
jgi:hypothetical protein